MAAELDKDPQYTARELLREIQRRGGRVYRFHHLAVFALTNDPAVAEWLVELGARRYVPPGLGVGADGGYWRSKDDGIREWDLYVHTIPVRGEESVWEAAGRNRKVELKVVGAPVE